MSKPGLPPNTTRKSSRILILLKGPGQLKDMFLDCGGPSLNALKRVIGKDSLSCCNHQPA